MEVSDFDAQSGRIYRDVQDARCAGVPERVPDDLLGNVVCVVTVQSGDRSSGGGRTRKETARDTVH
jgi:hypothetical protein